MSNYQQKSSWSLQDNKRSQEERDVFKPTGKSPKKLNTTIYVVLVILITFLASLSLTVSSGKKLEVCLFSDLCFNSRDDVFLYSFYVFTTIAVIVIAVFVAYKFGKRFGSALKQ